MKKEPKIFVIIVTYKGMRWYDKCFSSLRESTIPLQTVVVDNTLGNEDAEYIKTHYPDIHLIKTNENLGFGRANNLGMRYALDNGCDYVFLLNQDAWILSDTMERLVTISKKHPEFGILSPMHMNAELNKVIMAYYDENNNVDLVNDLYCNTVKPYYKMRYVNAAAWLMTREILEKIGGFCPMIFQYGEDDDYLNRVYYHKIPLVLCPDSRIVHDTRETLSEQHQCREKAAREHLYKHLDLNQSFSFRDLSRKYIKRYLRAVCRLDTNKAYNIRIEYSTLIQNRKGIEECRRVHQIMQPNWL